MGNSSSRARAARESDATPPPQSPARRALDGIVCAIFLAVLVAPTVDTFVRDDAARGPAPELRLPAREPALGATQASISAFPQAYEAYFSDTMGLRDVLLRGNSALKYFVFGVSASPNRVVGRDGWMFYTGDRSEDVFRGLFPFEPGTLKAWAAELENRRRTLESAGVRYLFVIVPNKETIYPERMPRGTEPLGPTRLDPFYDYLRAHTQVDFLDLRPALGAAKANDTGPMDALYSPHGTHWTGRGCMVVYDALTSRVAAAFPGSKRVPSSEFSHVPIPYGVDSFAISMYLEGLLTQPDTVPVRTGGWKHSLLESRDAPPRWRRTRTEDDALLPHTILFHDSFGPFVYEQLSESFTILDASEGEYVPTRVEAGQTRLVIEMFVERYLVNHAPNIAADERIARLPEDFAAVPHRLYSLDLAGGGYEALAGMKVEVVTSGDAPALRFSRQSAKEGIVTPEFIAPESAEVLARVVVECPVPASLEIMWRATATEPNFTRARRVIVDLHSGRNETFVRLPLTGGATRLMMRPSETGTELTLRALELRSARAP